MKKTRKKDEWGALRFHFSEICSWVDDHGREPNPNEPRYIFTEVGVGYRMADSASEEGRAEPDAQPD